MKRTRGLVVIAVLAVAVGAVAVAMRSGSASRVARPGLRSPKAPSAQSGTAEQGPQRHDDAPVPAEAASRDLAYETRRYAQLNDEDFREEVFSLIDSIRWARAGKDGEALSELFARLRAMGDRAIPYIYEELKLARVDEARTAAIAALQSLGPVRDPARLAAALGGVAAGSPSRVHGAWLLLGLKDPGPAAQDYLQSVLHEARSHMADAAGALPTRSLSVQVVGGIAGRAAEPEMLTIARASDQPFAMRYGALLALTRNGVSPEAAQALAPLAGEKQSMLRTLAIGLTRGGGK